MICKADSPEGGAFSAKEVEDGISCKCAGNESLR